MHSVSLLQAVLVGIWAAIAGIDQFNGLLHIHRPIVTGAVIGIILGEPTTGIITGGALELVWAGMVPLAGAQPPNVVVGGVIGTLFAVLSGLSPTTAVGVAVPFSVAMQALITLIFTVFAPISHKMDSCAQNGDVETLNKIAWIQPIVFAIGFFLVGFFPAVFGQSVISVVVSNIPAWIISGFSVAGGIMPAVGFAMLLKIMWKIDYAPFFIIGFVCAAYLKIPVLGIALIVLSFALYDYFSNAHRSNKLATAQSGTTDSEKEDYSNGI